MYGDYAVIGAHYGMNTVGGKAYIFKKNRIKPFKVFDENNLSSLPRIILSSVLVILFFYSLPIIVNLSLIHI